MVGSSASKAKKLLNNIRYYWKEPQKGRYIPFKEVAAYSFGGIGAYMLIYVGSTLLVTTTNMLVGGAIGVAPTDMYILYILSTIVNLPLTAVRANMIDNTRGKGGKYRPYLISMGLPTVLVSVCYVWFPYEKLGYFFKGELFGKKTSYVVLCLVVLLFNFLLQFFYNFFNDAYTNLIHVLSPNTQERTDVLAVKSVVYSFGPSVIQFAMPLVAKYVSNDNLYDIKVYRITYPIFAIVGMLMTIIVYANSKERIVQAKTHTIQIGFFDSLREVAKNKYFWIISIASWVGFLETSYSTVLEWSYNYGHTTDGATFSVIRLLIGNASLWGMILAPFCIRKFGKKKVLIAVNFFNVLFIIGILIDIKNIWWIFACMWLNYFVGSFEQITTPAIQADIRDYQQYRSGERIDGMFGTVITIGNMLMLATSSVMPAVQKHYGVYEGNGYDKPFDILDVNNGDSELLYKLMTVIILLAALGAFLNMVPYFFYDLNEKKQKSIIRVLQVRSLFEDYSNNALKNKQLVEAIDMVNNARALSAEPFKSADKNDYFGLKGDQKKAAKAKYREAIAYNEEIEISKFVCKELDKFNSTLGWHKSEIYQSIYEQGVNYVKSIDLNAVRSEIKKAADLPKKTEEDKEYREFVLELAKSKRMAKRAYDKYYGSMYDLKEPDMALLTALFDREDTLDAQIFELAENKDKAGAKLLTQEKKSVQKQAKALMDEFAKFNRAAKPYNEAKKFLKQQESYSRFDEIAALYDEAKLAALEEERLAEEERRQRAFEEQAELEKRKQSKKK